MTASLICSFHIWEEFLFVSFMFFIPKIVQNQRIFGRKMKENLFLSYHLCVFRVLSYQMKIVALHS